MMSEITGYRINDENGIVSLDTVQLGGLHALEGSVVQKNGGKMSKALRIALREYKARADEYQTGEVVVSVTGSTLMLDGVLKVRKP